MRKITKIVCLIVMFFILSGCMQLDVACGIDKDHTAYLNYSINMDMENIDYELKSEINNYVKKLIVVYEGYGFTTNDKSTDDQLDIVLTYKKEASNYTEAYRNLQDILNDPKISFLLSTDMTSEAKKHEQGFIFKAETDVSKILSTSYLDTLPKNISSIIQESLLHSEIQFSFTLPQSTVVESNGSSKNENGYTTISFPVDLHETSKFSAMVRMSLDDNKAIKGDIDTLVKKNKQAISIYETLLPVSIVLAGCLTITSIYLVLRKRKNS